MLEEKEDKIASDNMDEEVIAVKDKVFDNGCITSDSNSP